MTGPAATAAAAVEVATHPAEPTPTQLPRLRPTSPAVFAARTSGRPSLLDGTRRRRGRAARPTAANLPTASGGDVVCLDGASRRRLTLRAVGASIRTVLGGSGRS